MSKNNYFDFSESLNLMSECLKKALAPLTEIQFHQSMEFFDSLSMRLKQLSLPIIDNCSANQLSETMKILSEYLAAITKDALFHSYNFDFSEFLNEISINDGYVELSTEASESVSKLIESQEVIEIHIDETKSSNKLTIKDFFVEIFIPVVFAIITIIQNSYFHKIDSLEAQKCQMETREYEAQQLKLMEQHNATLEKIYDSINEFLEIEDDSLESLISDSDLPYNANYSDAELNVADNFLDRDD